MKYKLSWFCPSNITAVIPLIRATQPGRDDETGSGPAVSDSRVYAFYQMPDAFNARPRRAEPFTTDVVEIFCYFQTQVLYVILGEKTNTDKGTFL